MIACRRIDCRAVLVAGRELREPGTSINPRPLELAMAAFAGSQFVLLRADAIDGERGLVPRLLPKQRTVARERAPTRIHPLRGYYDLAELWPDYELDWRPHPTLVRPPPGREVSAPSGVGPVSAPSGLALPRPPVSHRRAGRA